MIQPFAVVTLLAADREDHAQQSTRDPEKLPLGLDGSVTLTDSNTEHGQQSLSEGPLQVS